MPKKAGPRQERFSEFPFYASHAIFFPGVLSVPAFENPHPLPLPPGVLPVFVPWLMPFGLGCSLCPDDMPHVTLVFLVSEMIFLCLKSTGEKYPVLHIELRVMKLSSKAGHKYRKVPIEK